MDWACESEGKQTESKLPFFQKVPPRLGWGLPTSNHPRTPRIGAPSSLGLVNSRCGSQVDNQGREGGMAFFIGEGTK